LGAECGEEEAIRTMLEVMDKESDAIMKREVEELRKQGINAVSCFWLFNSFYFINMKK